MSSPYLNLAFFSRLGETLPEHVLLVLAEREGKPIAAALNVFSREALYGRYWGATQHLPCLHFETCYYQALDFCIERGNRGLRGRGARRAQARARVPAGENLVGALARHPQFADAIERFLAREAQGVERYADELAEHSPFRREP